MRLLTVFASLLLATSLSPYLSFGDIKISETIPWFVSPIALLIFVLLFVPCIPGKVPISPAEKELRYRFKWLRKYLDVQNLTIINAWKARDALNGKTEGEFKVTAAQFKDMHIEPIINNVKNFPEWDKPIDQLRDLCDKLPDSSVGNAMVPAILALNLKMEVKKLPD